MLVAEALTIHSMNIEYWNRTGPVEKHENEEKKRVNGDRTALLDSFVRKFASNGISWIHFLDATMAWKFTSEWRFSSLSDEVKIGDIIVVVVFYLRIDSRERCRKWITHRRKSKKSFDKNFCWFCSKPCGDGCAMCIAKGTGRDAILSFRFVECVGEEFIVLERKMLAVFLDDRPKGIQITKTVPIQRTKNHNLCLENMKSTQFSSFRRKKGEKKRHGGMEERSNSASECNIFLRFFFVLFLAVAVFTQRRHHIFRNLKCLFSPTWNFLLEEFPYRLA